MKLTFVVIAMFMAQAALAAERTVCTAAINSTEEIQAFKKKLEPQGFKFVELVPQAAGEDNTGDWFKDACKSGVQCDVLIISGHFSGEFFGKSNVRLPLELMQQQSCAKTCDGILKNPKEVFLFGCNTLAGKNHDGRTPEQYHQALINDGIDRVTADERTAILYSSLGASFGSSIQQVFEQVPVINGFDGMAPSGIHVMGDVQEYLKQSGNYQDRIDKLEGQKVVATVALGSKSLNPVWYSTVPGNRMSCSGAATQDKLVCQLMDEKKSRFEKLLVAREMLNSPDSDKYLLVAGKFVADASASHPTKDEQAVIDQITQMPFKDKILKQWASFNKAPGIQGDFASILKLWKHDPQVQNTLIQALNADSAVMCEATASLSGLDNPKATAIEIKIMNSTNKDSEYRRCATTGLHGTTDPAGVAALTKGLSDSDVGVRENAADAMVGMKLTPQMETALAKSLKDNEYMVRSLAAKALQGTTNHDAQMALVNLLSDSQYDVFHNAYMSLAQANDPVILRAIQQFRINHPNEEPLSPKILDQSSNQ